MPPKQFTVSEIAQFCIEQDCSTKQKVLNSILILKRSGNINFNTFNKLNIKKLCEYVLIATGNTESLDILDNLDSDDDNLDSDDENSDSE